MPNTNDSNVKTAASGSVEANQFTRSEALGHGMSDLKVGTKYDQDKSRVELVDSEFIEGLGRVMAFGANKYAAHNWRKGIAISRICGGAMRHLLAILRGEDLDGESGLPHVHHLGCCVMFLSWMLVHRPDLDDRFKY